MKRPKIFLALAIIMIAQSYAQNMMIGYQPRKLKLRTPEFHLFVPLPLFSNYYQKYNESVIEQYSLMIYKSPVKHTAVFCRMEDLTQKKFGVMIQFHVGNYNSSMDFKIPQRMHRTLD